MILRYLSRFWRRVALGDDCWEWTGPPGSHGYGQSMREDKSITTAPRMAFELSRGHAPEHFVCHTCNNKMCVRPSHLYDGTHRQNMDDIARGKYHPKRKLTSEQAACIKASGGTQRALAAKHGVTQQAIWAIKKGLTYRYD